MPDFPCCEHCNHFDEGSGHSAECETCRIEAGIGDDLRSDTGLIVMPEYGHETEGGYPVA
jgi:hypothetical protein